METLFSGTLACLHIFRHICIAVSTLILHLLHTCSYHDNRFLDDPTKYYYHCLLVGLSGGPSDSDFGLSRSHRPLIDLIIILNDVSIRNKWSILTKRRQLVFSGGLHQTNATLTTFEGLVG